MPLHFTSSSLSSFNLIRNITANTEWFLDNNPIGNKKSRACVGSFALTAKAKKGQIHTGLPLFYVLRGLSTKLCLQERMLSTDTLG